jgi:hypothetical protein
VLILSSSRGLVETGLGWLIRRSRTGGNAAAGRRSWGQIRGSSIEPRLNQPEGEGPVGVAGSKHNDLEVAEPASCTNARPGRRQPGVERPRERVLRVVGRLQVRGAGSHECRPRDQDVVMPFPRNDVVPLWLAGRIITDVKEIRIPHVVPGWIHRA